VVVAVETAFPHPIYQKTVQPHHPLQSHDEDNRLPSRRPSPFTETRPLSRTSVGLSPSVLNPTGANEVTPMIQQELNSMSLITAAPKRIQCIRVWAPTAANAPTSVKFDRCAVRTPCPTWESRVDVVKAGGRTDARHHAAATPANSIRFDETRRCPRADNNRKATVFRSGRSRTAGKRTSPKIVSARPEVILKWPTGHR